MIPGIWNDYRWVLLSTFEWLHLELNSFHLSGCSRSFCWVLLIWTMTSSKAALALSRVRWAESLFGSFWDSSSMCCSLFSQSRWGPLSLKKAWREPLLTYPGMFGVSIRHDLRKNGEQTRVPKKSQNARLPLVALFINAGSPDAPWWVSHSPYWEGTGLPEPALPGTPVKTSSNDFAPIPFLSAAGDMAPPPGGPGKDVRILLFNVHAVTRCITNSLCCRTQDPLHYWGPAPVRAACLCL